MVFKIVRCLFLLSFLLRRFLLSRFLLSFLFCHLESPYILRKILNKRVHNYQTHSSSEF